ncbi:MAG: PAS domain S-box protein [Fibrobacteria bacterium]|nr:PAS domain S-box protein [Fibrobacteria bacterium]
MNPDVVFLNSYHPGLYWSDQVLEGVRSKIPGHCDMAVEFLDSKRREDPASDSLIAQLLYHKYRQSPPRAILSADDYAFQFLMRWRDSLFPGVPVVFCGVNGFHPEMLQGRDKITGISEWNNVAGTLRLVLELLPRTRDVWFVTENTATGRVNRRRLDSLSRTLDTPVRYHFLDSAGAPSWKSLMDHVQALQTGDVVYWSELFRDSADMFLEPERDLRALAAVSKVPIFSHSEQYVRAGAIGGICNRGFEHGRQAGGLLERVLLGEDPDSIPIQSDSSIAPLFDWKTSTRFHFPPQKLPAGTIFLGRPRPVWRTHPIQTATMASAILLLGLMSGVLGIALVRSSRDRGALERSETALRQSEGDLRRLFDTLADAVIVHDSSGHVEFMNQGGMSMYRLTPEAMRDLDIPAISSAESLAELDLCDLWERVSTDGSILFEWKARRPLDQSEFDVEVALTSLSFEGESRYVAVVRDISERIEARKVLEESKDALEKKVQERTQELLGAIRELESFSYSISHDLRTPLRSLNGFAHALQEDLGPVLQPEQKSHLARIQAGAIRMGEIIDDLLRLSRMTTTPIHPSAMEMDPLVREAIVHAGEPAGRVSWKIAPLGGAVGDPNLLAIVWEQLVSNAVKFSSEQSEPRVEIGRLRINGRAVWFIRDNGTGFDSSQATHLFQPFRRLHDPEEFPGEGIGLAIAGRIVARHNGKIWAESTPGGGATFFFSLD